MPSRREIARLVFVTTLIASSVSWALVSRHATSALAAPGTPGTPQPATVVVAEGFQNRPGPAPIVRLTGYSGSGGQTYTAAPTWLVGCNGWVASANEATTAAGGAGPQVTDCLSPTNWNRAQQLAQSLGMAAGQTAAAARDNYAVTAYTANNPGAGLVEFQTATNVPFATSNRFIAFSADVAAFNCNVSAPLLQFSLLSDTATAIPAGSPVNACTSPRTVTVPALGVVGAIAARVGTYTANGSVLITGSSIGVRMVNANGSGSGNDHAFDNITILDVTPQLDKSFSPTVVGVGQPSTLTFTVTNTAELASKNGWSFTDNLPAGLTVAGAPATTCPSGVVTAALGGSTVSVSGNLSAGMLSCTVTVNVSSTALGSFTNGPSNISPRSGVNPPATSTVTFTQTPALSIVKASTTTLLPPVGTAVPYTFLVTNTGNVSMSGIAVADSNTTGVSCPATTLTPGVSTTCTGSHTVTQGDIDASSITNTATVVGTPPIGSAIAPVLSNRVTILASQLPALSIVKSSTTVSIPAVGQTIPYSFGVTNTGNVTMTGIAVTDPNVTAIACAETTLAPTGSTTCTGTHTVSQADLDAAQVVNTASVLGTPPSGTPIAPVPSNQVTITGAQHPALSIVKSSTSTNLPIVGEPIPYTFLVTNIGDVTMGAIAVTDPNTTGVSCTVTTLSPGALTTCTGNHTVIQADLDAGQVTNTATVIGTPPGGSPIPAVLSNPVTIPGVPNSALSIVKSSTTTAVLAVNQIVPYTFSVTNIGNVTMNAITVTDPDANNIFCPSFTLPPGTSTTCTGIHTVTQADMNAGEINNTANAIGTPPVGPTIPPVPSNEITIKAAQSKSISILKTSTATSLPPVGASVPYEFVVTNTGNVTITAIAITDPNTTGVTCPVTTLDPGTETTCTAIHLVSQIDIDDGGVINTASVVGTPPDGVPIPPVPSNDVTIAGTRTPALSIVKSSTTTAITTIGQTVAYTFTLTNIGNVTLSNVTVSDPKITTVSCGQTTLLPGIATTCNGTYSVTANDLDSGQLVNTATAIGSPPAGLTIPPAQSNTVTTPAAQSPSLSIVKSSTANQATTVGQVIPFTFVVTNTGNVTITDIVVTDPKIATVNCPHAALAAAESMTCTADYTVTQADVEAGQVINTATVGGMAPGGVVLTLAASNQVLVPIPTAEAAPTTPPAQLPVTGTDIASPLRIPSTLALVGIALIALARRRHSF